jgi:ATP-binding cassette subfamily B protein
VNNLLRLSPSYFEANRPAEVASRLTADTTLIEQAVGTTASVALRNLVLAIGGITYLFTLAPKLAAMLLLGIPLILGPILFIGRRLRDMSRQSQDRIADVGVIIDEVLGAMKIVSVVSAEELVESPAMRIVTREKGGKQKSSGAEELEARSAAIQP